MLIGGSGLIGGTLLHAFEKRDRFGIHVLAPNSKELSLRVPEDIRAYFSKVRADFIINCAVASLSSDAQLTMEVTAMGPIHLARIARDLGIPYIHISSAAFMPYGTGIGEDDRPPLRPTQSNYAKGKLMAEMGVERLHRSGGLDFTTIRLAIVYGTHDHKAQGFQHLLYSIANGSMPFLLTRPDCLHTYTNAKKLPAFVAHVLRHRDEFSGETYHFVDPEPVPLAELILTIRGLLGKRTPRRIFVPFFLARLLAGTFPRLLRAVRALGIEARPPSELVFLQNFYESQALSCDKLRRSSFVDEAPDETIFTQLPELIRYYVDRWEHFNLIEPTSEHAEALRSLANRFENSPEALLDAALEEVEDGTRT